MASDNRTQDVKNMSFVCYGQIERNRIFMKLSMSLIGTYLEKYQPECHISEDTMSIGGVRFLSASLGKFSKDYVYIGDAREYYQDTKYRDALLLTNGQNQILCRGADYEELLNDVLSAFEYYNQMEQRLILSAAQGSSLDELIQIMEPVYAGGILFFDMEGNLLAARHEEVLRGDALYEELEKNGRMELYTLGRVFLNEEGKVSHDLSDYARRLFMPGEILGTVAMYLTIQQERVGFLMMFPISELEAMAALHLEELFARYSVMAKEFTDTSSLLMPKRTILESILKGIMPEPEVLQQLELAVEMKADGRILVLENLGIQNYTMYHMLERDLALAGKNIACEYQNFFVVLTSTETLSKLTECIREKMVYGKYAAGISMAIQHVGQIGTAYRQALFAISQGNGEGIFRCEAFALEYLIQNLKNQDMAMELLHPLIGTLEHYDQENNTELLLTLRTWLLNGCSQQKAAEELHVHLNTLKYRLKRMEELGHLDVNMERDMFYLRLSVEMLEKPAVATSS